MALPEGHEAHGAVPAARLRDVSKAFAGVPAVRGVSLDLWPGETHGLVGENGAGKSTLLKILTGVHQPDSGAIELAGSPVVLHGPADARTQGISVVHQELAMFPDLTVAENVYIGRLPTSRAGVIDRGRLRREVRAALAQLDVELDVDAPMRGLSVGQAQLVEIAKGITADCRVLVLDEPTAALTPSESDVLFRILERLRAQGVAVAFVTHRLDEVFNVCQRVSVMRDGEMVASAPVGDLGPDMVIRHMVGRRLDGLYPTRQAPRPEVALEVIGLCREPAFRDVSFRLHAGEILGMAGLVGAGRTDSCRAIFGVEPADHGRIIRDGAQVRPRNAREAMAAGTAYLPEDRRGQGVARGP